MGHLGEVVEAGIGETEGGAEVGGEDVEGVGGGEVEGGAGGEAGELGGEGLVGGELGG